MKKFQSNAAALKTISVLIIVVAVFALVFTLAPGQTVKAANPVQTFEFKGVAGEFTGFQNGSKVIPTSGPSGTLVVRGTGNVSIENKGIKSETTGQQHTDVGFLQFANNIDSVFDPASGEISFSLTSKLSQDERGNFNQKWRYVYDVYDANGTQAFSFITNHLGSRIYFEYKTASTGFAAYYLPTGQEEVLFGKDKTLDFKIAWQNGMLKLFINGSDVQSQSYTPANLSFTTGGSLILGAQGPAGANSGFFTNDDLLSNFTVRKGTDVNFNTTTGGKEIDSSTNSTVPTTTAQTIELTRNSIGITERDGITTTNYPIQIGRPFVQGEIKNAPIAVVNGRALFTQADVKNRWSDGSVKFAVIAFILPQLNANSTVVVNFANQTKNSNTAPSQAELLDPKYNFDANIIMNNTGKTMSASAYSILQQGKYTFWTKGSIASTIILADHSSTREHDLGFDSYKPMRPIFEVTFWHSLNKIQTRFIGEISNTENLEDMTYSIKLTVGKNNPQTVYTKNSVTQIAGSRWTKEFWQGANLPRIAINPNLNYLKSTKLMASYDTSRSYSSATIDNAYRSWANAPKDITENGTIFKSMLAAGGREDLGLYPAWVVRWLYTGDGRSQDETLGNADLGGSFPIHYREGSSGKFFDKAHTVAALGKVLSVSARPTIYLQHPNTSGAKTEDKLKYVGAKSSNGYEADNAHQPELYSVPYIVTGDHYYLEQLQFWSAWSAAGVSFGTDVWWGRGPVSDGGGIHDQVRGDAWILRNRTLAATLSPDDSAEKEYFTNLTNDAIAIWEGERNITGTPFTNNSFWNWGKKIGTKQFPEQVASPIHEWQTGSTKALVTGGLKANVSSGTGPWEHYFLISALGRAQELGFQTESLKNWLGSFLGDQLTDPGYAPGLISVYELPTTKSADGKWFGSWTEARTGLPTDASNNPTKVFQDNAIDPDGYSYYARGAATFLGDTSVGLGAYTTINNMLSNPIAFNKDLKWALNIRQPINPTVAPTMEAGVPTGRTGDTNRGTTETTSSTMSSGESTTSLVGVSINSTAANNDTTKTNVTTSTDKSTNVLPKPKPKTTFITGTLVKDSVSGTVYMIYGKYKSSFASKSVLQGQGYSQNPVITGDTSLYTLYSVIKSKTAAHPRGSWLKKGNAYFFSHASGLISVPTKVFISHTIGNRVPVVNMNAADLKKLKAQKSLPALTFPDSRV